MHDEKVWALDVHEGLMLTGGGDSAVKAWRDATLEKEVEDKERLL